VFERTQAFTVNAISNTQIHPKRLRIHLGTLQEFNRKSPDYSGLLRANLVQLF
jgi:hypothetical protein